MDRLRQLIHEIHRRSLWQVLGIYLVGGWAAYTVVQSLTEGLGLPGWFPAFAVVLLIIGLPIVMATAFVQEGLSVHVEADSAARTAATASGLLSWRNALGGGVLAFALWGVVAAGWVLFERAGIGNDAGEDMALERSVAVLPLVNLSGDPRFPPRSSRRARNPSSGWHSPRAYRVAGGRGDGHLAMVREVRARAARRYRNSEGDRHINR